MINFQKKNKYDLRDLEWIISALRGEGGCPWDREQTHESLRRNILEESCEVIEAIDEKSPEHLREELGDVLMQIVFHADIEKDAGNFTLDDVADEVCKKLIYRHPHVFGDVTVSGTDEVLSNWDELKKKEKHQETVTDSMNAVAKSLPALWRAEKVQKKAAKVGFDFPDVQEALFKLQEEAGELREAIAEGTNVQEELGDLLFSAVNVARFVKADPEAALNGSTDKFIKRFDFVERSAGENLSKMSLNELDNLYNEGKKL
jgi:tetrapyrrole methylase family protein/MazG family protein